MDTDTVAERNGNRISIFLFSFYPITRGVLMFAASSCPINENLLCVRYTNNMLMWCIQSIHIITRTFNSFF